MGTYAFKPGPVRGEQTWRVDEQLSGPGGAIALSAVQEAEFSYSPTGRFHVTVLALGDGHSTVRLQCNDRPKGESKRAALALAKDVFERLAVVAPHVEVTSKGDKMLGWGMLFLGLCLMGTGIFFAAKGDGFGYVLGGIFGSLGLFLAWAASPWKMPKSESPAEVAERIGRIQAINL